MRKETEELKRFGFVFPAGAKPFPQTAEEFARDAALSTNPNSAVPPELTAYYDPTVIRILTAPQNARRVMSERKIGDWTTPYARFKQVEYTGHVQPYDDYANNGKADINVTYPLRENFVYETTVQYGDRESDIMSMSGINLAKEKQQSAALTLDLAYNRFAFYGVSGLQNFGLLNDPALPAALTPKNVGTVASPVTSWTDKTAMQIYNDILAMVSDMTTRSNGIITESTRIKMLISPARATLLKTAFETGVQTVESLLKAGLPNLEVVIAHEMSTASGELVQMWAEIVSVEGASQKVGELGYSEKFRAGRVVPFLSHYAQKFVAGTYGAIIYQPFAVSQMLGI